MTLWLALSFAFAQEGGDSVDTGDTGVFGQVVGGSQASKGAWPDTAAIVFNGGQVGCTGTLIAPDLVITAGHCLGGIQAVLLDTNDYTKGGEYIRVTKEWEYPNSWATLDIGLLKLEKKSSVAPRTIAQTCILDKHLKDGAPVQIVGYGALDIWGTQYGTKLMEAPSRVADHDCSDLWRGCNASVSPGGEITAGGDGVDACYGDSGGPLYLTTDKGDYLVGVTSRSYSNVFAPCEEGGIWGRPDAAVEWIEKTAGVSLPEPDCGENNGGNDGGGNDGGGNDGGGNDGGGNNGGGDNGGSNRAPDPYARPILVIQGLEATTVVSANDPDASDRHTFELVEQPALGEAAISGEGLVAFYSAVGGAAVVKVRVTDDGSPAESVVLEIPVEVIARTDEGGCSTAPGGGLGALILGLAAILRRRRR